MNKKQNSLMRFSRTERLAQLSEQEIVIEKKKREIQAKLEARKKKETEEALKKLEFSTGIKNTEAGFSKKAWSGNEFKKNISHDKPIENVKESPTNAFSNDGTFLDQFKKLSQSGLSCIPDSGRIKLNNFKKDEKLSKESSQISFSKNSSDSGAQLETQSDFEFSHHQSASVCSATETSKSTVFTHPVQIAQVQEAQLQPAYESFPNKMPLKQKQFNYSDKAHSVASIQPSESCQSFNSKESLANESGSSYVSSAFPQSKTIPESSPSVPPSALTSELPKVRSESISMTLKINPVKKLEAIPNPLETDQTEPLDLPRKNKFSLFKNESSNNASLNTVQDYSSAPIRENVTASSRISSAFCNKKEDDEDNDEDGGHLNEKHKHWASLVARCGDEFEDSLRSRHENDPDLRFLTNKTSEEYLSYRKLVIKYRLDSKSSEEGLAEKALKLNLPKTYNELSVEDTFSETSNEDNYKMKSSDEVLPIHGNQFTNFESNSVSESALKIHSSNFQTQSEEASDQILKEESSVEQCEKMKSEERRKRKRKSRWGDAEPTTSAARIETDRDLQIVGKLPAPKSTLLSQLTRSDPGLIQYAKQTFGSTNLSEEDWKKAEDHYKINLLYQDMIKKRAEVEKLERQGKFKYEYDSDEDTEGGTWEHKLRQQEMQATQLWAEELTRQAAGKHHIGDFLPPEELERFMEKYNAVKEGREPDLSDYKEYKLKEDNVGYRLLQKMGWNEGQGLGQDGSGITNPVNKGVTRHENQGLGVERPDGLEAGDDEYDAYRKRMMLAYRFRPNPLNNPRRPYY